MRAFRTTAMVGLGLAGAGVAVASAAPGEADRAGTEVIHAVRTTEDATGLDLGAPGNTLGDQQAFTARFEVDGRNIGFDGGVCTLVRLPLVYQCVATNSLPKGLLTAQGLIDYEKAPGPFSFAITGGTGQYRAARGDVRILSGETSDRVTFRIITR